MSESPLRPPSYKIRSVADFLDVPPERLPLCLAEFTHWLAFQRAWNLSGLGPAPTAAADDPCGVFTWIDDGRRDLEVNILGPEGDEVLHRQTFRYDEPDGPAR